jgi:5'(3')-deoxyribonucleotidase
MRANEFTPKKSKPRVYLDMDGVLADFFTEYAKLAGIESGNYRDIPPAKADPTLNKMVGTNFFARLPKFPTADALVSMTVKIFGGYSICSSPLRGDHKGSEHYKREWISQHLRPGPQEIIITPNKSKFAVQPDGTPNILVDDRGSNITGWEAAGGIGIKYQADEDSLSIVMQGYRHALDIVKGDIKHKPKELVSKDRGQMIATPDKPRSDTDTTGDQQ